MEAVCDDLGVIGVASVASSAVAMLLCGPRRLAFPPTGSSPVGFNTKSQSCPPSRTTASPPHKPIRIAIKQVGLLLGSIANLWSMQSLQHPLIVFPSFKQNMQTKGITDFGQCESHGLLSGTQ